MQTARNKFNWIKQTNNILDNVSLEIANSVCINHPFDSDSVNCLFNSALNSSLQGPSSITKGFSFINGNLVYIEKNSQNRSKNASFNGMKNPLIQGCKNGKFKRVGPAELKISFAMHVPDNSGITKQFSRSIYLRNK